jgi:hypothetical protein
MKAKRGLFLIILMIAIRTGFAQEVREKTEYPNLVKNGDFEDGLTGFKSDFINDPTNDVFTWGYYVVTDNVAKYRDGREGFFVNPVPNTGKYYAIDMNNSGKQRLWYDSITVKPNTTYSFSCILANVNADFAAPGVMNLKINGRKVCPSWTLSNGSAAWIPFSIKYKTGPNENRIEISIVDEIWTLMGNDVALDNIVFKEIPPEEFTSSCGVIFHHHERFQCIAIVPGRRTLGREWAEKELKSALNDAKEHNVIKDPNFTILNSEEKAIKFAEPILFDIYGKTQIESERPYEIYNIDNYWVIGGTLPKANEGLIVVGGTFLIIFNAQDCKVIRISHGR